MIIKTTCIMCPLGCSLEIDRTGKTIKVSGHACPRGEEYGKAEVTKPLRSLTTLITTPSGVASVKTTGPIPKRLIKKALAYIDTIKIDHEPVFHEVIEKDFLGTRTNLVVTRQ